MSPRHDSLDLFRSALRRPQKVPSPCSPNAPRTKATCPPAATIISVRDTLGMTPGQLRLILGDALDGAAERLRAGAVPDAGPADTAQTPSIRDPLPEVTVLRVGDVAQLLTLSRWKVYECWRRTQPRGRR